MRRYGLFDDFISHGPIHSAVFRDCSPASLICLSKTCRLARNIVDSWMNLAYNINRFLSRYFNMEETLHFRHLQAAFGVIISGSSALQFLDRTRYPDSDLDIYVEAKFVDSIGRWLISCGYEFIPKTAQKPTFTKQFNHMMRNAEIWADMLHNEYRNMGIAGVFNMKKGDRHIQLIGAQRCPVEIVLSFHSTCVMNFIAYNAAYSLYPRSTFEDRTALLIQTSGTQESQTKARDKYKRRGWKITEGDPQYLSSSHHRSSAFGGMERNMGDRYIWTIPLDIKGVSIPNFMMTNFKSGIGRPGSAIIANSWKLLLQPRLQEDDEEDDAGLPLPIASYTSTVFTSNALKFVYLISDTLPLKYFEAAFEVKEFTDFLDADFNELIHDLYNINSRIERLAG